MDVDLNIDNYNLEDLLQLFHLPINFTEQQLKNAKGLVLKTHPDKSGLNKEYFLFFSKAFKYIVKIHELRKSSNTNSTDYDIETYENYTEEQETLINNKIGNMSKKDFHIWFNKTFETMKIKDDNENEGYGNWLQSDDDISNDKVNNLSEIHNIIKNKKKYLKAIVKHNDIEDFNSNTHYDLIRGRQEDYGSGDIFGKLKFEDLKKAHTETVVPVDHDDYLNREHFNNIDELNRRRTMQTTNIEYADHDTLMNNSRIEDQRNIERAYKLLKQDEVIQNNYNKFWSKLKRLENN
jgi:hypothetical protein